MNMILIRKIHCHMDVYKRVYLIYSVKEHSMILVITQKTHLQCRCPLFSIYVIESKIFKLTQTAFFNHTITIIEVTFSKQRLQCRWPFFAMNRFIPIL